MNTLFGRKTKPTTQMKPAKRTVLTPYEIATMLGQVRAVSRIQMSIVLLRFRIRSQPDPVFQKMADLGVRKRLDPDLV